jgi:hypothetical protein
MHKLKGLRMKNIFKNFLFVLVISSLGFWGCSDTLTTEPQDNISVEKTTETNLAKLPALPTELSATKTINGERGGMIVLAGLYRTTQGRLITVAAALFIPPNAFEGTKEITVTTDEELPSLHFSPCMAFDIPLYLNLTFVGFDLRELGLTPWNTKFCYIGDDGTVEEVSNDGVTVNLYRSSLGVQRARIEHFSRFGFTR